MKREDVAADPVAVLKARTDAYNAHLAARAGHQDNLEDAEGKIRLAQETIAALAEPRARREALEQQLYQARAHAYASGKKLDAGDITRQIKEELAQERAAASEAEDAAAAIALVLAPARDKVAQAYVDESQQGAALRYELLRAVIDVELDRHRQAFATYVEAHARVAAACLAADRFADPQAGRPNVGTIPYSISMRPHIPEVALPGIDPARAVALASWEIPVGPLTAEALAEFLRLVEG